MKFEEKMNQLEMLISELESNTDDLEESIQKYTKAMKLIKECEGQLTDIEKKVTKMIQDGEEKELETLE